MNDLALVCQSAFSFSSPSGSPLKDSVLAGGGVKFKTLVCKRCSKPFQEPERPQGGAIRKFCLDCRHAATIERQANWVKNHPVQSRLKYRKHYSKNRDLRNQWNKDALALLKADVQKKFGNKCNHCPESRPEILTVDHVNGDGCKERKEGGSRISYYRRVLADDKNRYQLLCMNCNWWKRFIKGENKSTNIRYRKPAPISQSGSDCCI